jgi:hypothetical protein
MPLLSPTTSSGLFAAGLLAAAITAASISAAAYRAGCKNVEVEGAMPVAVAPAAPVAVAPAAPVAAAPAAPIAVAPAARHPFDHKVNLAAGEAFFNEWWYTRDRTSLTRPRSGMH